MTSMQNTMHITQHWICFSFRPWISLIWEILARNRRQISSFFGARLFWNHTNSVWRSIYGLFHQKYRHWGPMICFILTDYRYWGPIICLRLTDYGHWGPIICFRLTDYLHWGAIICFRVTDYGHWGPKICFRWTDYGHWGPKISFRLTDYGHWGPHKEFFPKGEAKVQTYTIYFAGIVQIDPK